MVEKPWSYELYPEVLRSNIFCYGKSGTGKTTRVAIPVLHNAIDEGRSCIVYAEHTTEEYADVREHAYFSDYRIYDLDTKATEDFRQIRTARKIVAEINSGDKPVLVLVSNPMFRVPHQKNVVDQLISRLALYNKTKANREDLSRGQINATLIVLDGLCENMLIPSCMLEFPWVQFCIIMDEKIAYKPWRERAISAAMQSDLVPDRVKEKLFGCTYSTLLGRLFLHIETVMCTGVPNIKPEMNKEFITECVLRTDGSFGGRFMIMEKFPQVKPENIQISKPSNSRKIKFDEDSIEDSAYSEIAEKYLAPGGWVAEHDGKMLIERNRGQYLPVSFNLSIEGLSWMNLKLRHDGIKLINKEQSEGIIRYECEADGQRTEYCLIRVNEGEKETHHINFFIAVLKMAEYDELARWMKTQEAIEQGYDPKDGLDANIKKYYAKLEAEAIAEEPPIVEQDKSEPISVVDRYWEKYFAKNQKAEQPVAAEEISLPEDGVLFLGGHWNMVKKIRQLHPEWLFITDDGFKPYSVINTKYVFYWTAHSSHTLMENIFKKLAPDAEIMYVTATNLELLEKQMQERYADIETRKRRGGSEEVSG